MFIKRKLYRILLIVAACVLFTYFIAGTLLPNLVVRPLRTYSKLHPKELALKYRLFELDISEDVVLKGYRIYSSNIKPKGLIIMVHGIGGHKEQFLGIAKKLAKRGIESIIFDGRAHGESTGTYCTYGFYEKNDISKIIDFIKTASPELSIGVWGNSMGGAIALQAMAKDKRISFGVIESTFTDLGQIVYDYKKRYLFGMGLRFISDWVLKKAGHLANFNPELVRPLNAVTQINQPVLISHGDSDKNIDFRYGMELFENLCSGEKMFLKVKGGGHYNLSKTGGKEYLNSILKFIEKQF